MKTLLITSIVLCSCACYAHVRSGPNNTYTVDNMGAKFDGKNQEFNSKVQFVEECKAVQCQPFKSSGSVAIF